MIRKGSIRRRDGSSRVCEAARRVHEAAQRSALVGALALVSLAPRVSPAAGWDTPIVHTARHQGMGGTAIGSVDDPSASFHNPAGYGGVEGLALLGSFSLLLGHLQTSPAAHDEGRNVRSELVVAPFPLFAAGYRLHDWVVVGVGGFPVASGAASYSYPATTGDQDVEDRMRAVFFEITPGVALTVPEKILPGNLSIGVGYRITAVTFDRKQGTDASTLLDFNLSGWDYTGFRVGAQYSPLENLRLGVVARNLVTVTAKSDEGEALGSTFKDIELDFKLPFKIGGGARYDYQRFGVALDYEFALQSQNDVVELSGVRGEADERTTIENQFKWQNGHTVRGGVEYRAPLQKHTIPLRAGYVFDGQVSNKEYPTAFGTPPAPTHSFTLGSGFHTGSFEANIAGAYRFGATEVAGKDPECLFCGEGGDYAISLFGAYVDVSYEFDL